MSLHSLYIQMQGSGHLLNVLQGFESQPAVSDMDRLAVERASRTNTSWAIHLNPIHSAPLFLQISYVISGTLSIRAFCGPWSGAGTMKTPNPRATLFDRQLDCRQP